MPEIRFYRILWLIDSQIKPELLYMLGRRGLRQALVYQAGHDKVLPLPEMFKGVESPQSDLL